MKRRKDKPGFWIVLLIWQGIPFKPKLYRNRRGAKQRFDILCHRFNVRVTRGTEYPDRWMAEGKSYDIMAWRVSYKWVLGVEK